MDEENIESGNEMNFLEHLEVMRWVIIKCLLTFIIVCAGLSFFFDRLMAFLMGPLHRAENLLGMEIQLRMSNFTSPIFIVMYIVFIGGFAISLPIMLYFIASFLLPALNKNEKAVLLPAVFSAIGLFFLGAALAYFFILPLGLYFSSTIAMQTLGLDMLVDAETYYSLVSWTTVGIGFAFELPLLQVLLIYVGILKIETLKKFRRWIIVILFFLSAIITPPDAVSQLILAMPLWILFELALIVGGVLLKRKQKKERAEELAELEEERQERLALLAKKNKAILEKHDAENKDSDDYVDEFEALEKEAENPEINNAEDFYTKHYQEDDTYGEHLYDDYIQEAKDVSALEPKWELNTPNLEPKWDLNKEEKPTDNESNI